MAQQLASKNQTAGNEQSGATCASSVSSSIPATASSSSSSSSDDNKLHPSTVSYIMAACILGSSAGMTLYSRKSGAMLSRMKQISENRLAYNPPKFGPPTRAEWEKMRPRWGGGD